MDIQVRQGGHDPEEDARACLELLKKKLKEGSSAQYLHFLYLPNVIHVQDPNLVSSSRT